MSTKYMINYEALVYNMPECGDFEILGHIFIPHPVTPEIEKIIMPDNDILKGNHALLSCCQQYADGHFSFLTVKNKTPVELYCDNISDDDFREEVMEVVRARVDSAEQHLIFITNLHIFFPVVRINICSEDGIKKRPYGYMNNRPMPFRKWTYIAENIDIGRRLNFFIRKDIFDKFRLHKNHTRYNRAFDYYIRSFQEMDHSSAFCILCSALDAITGCNDAKYTKDRLAKYSSILFCTPLEMQQSKEKMCHFYKIRSTFVHGKGSQITVQDEVELREYVRKFLIAYFLFWGEMGIKNEAQMLQKLDQIYADPSLYVRYAPAAYSFISIYAEHEKRTDGVISMTMPQKYLLLVSKMLEAIVAKPPTITETNRIERDGTFSSQP